MIAQPESASTRVESQALTNRGIHQVLKGVGLPEGLAQAIAGWDVAASQGALFDDSQQLSALMGQPTTPLSAVVGTALKQIA